MPCAAAATVTSGSLAAPSSIEYSVWTCRCANESVLTGGGAPQWSCVPGRRGPRGRDDGQATGGEDRQCCVLGMLRCVGVLLCPSAGSGPMPPILAPLEVYSEGLTGRVSSHRTDPRGPRPPRHSHARGGPLQEAASEPAAHGDVADARLLVLLPDGHVSGPLVEAPG